MMKNVKIDNSILGYIIYPNSSWGQLRKTIISINKSIQPEAKIFILKNRFYKESYQNKINKEFVHNNFVVINNVEEINQTSILLHSGDTIKHAKKLFKEMKKFNKNNSDMLIFKVNSPKLDRQRYMYKKVNDSLLLSDEKDKLKADLDASGYIVSPKIIHKLDMEFYKNPVNLIDFAKKIQYSNQIYIERMMDYTRNTLSSIKEQLLLMEQIVTITSEMNNSNYFVERILNEEMNILLQSDIEKFATSNQLVELREFLYTVPKKIIENLDLEAYMRIQQFMNAQPVEFKKATIVNTKVENHAALYTYKNKNIPIEKHYNDYVTNIFSDSESETLTFLFNFYDEIVDTKPQVRVFFEDTITKQRYFINIDTVTKNKDFIAQRKAGLLNENELVWNIDYPENQYAFSFFNNKNIFEEMIPTKYILGIERKYSDDTKVVYLTFKEKLEELWTSEKQRLIYSIDNNGFLVLDLRKNEDQLFGTIVEEKRLVLDIQSTQKNEKFKLKLLNKKAQQIFYFEWNNGIELEQFEQLPEGVYQLFFEDESIKKHRAIVGGIKPETYYSGKLSILISHNRVGAIILSLKQADLWIEDLKMTDNNLIMKMNLLEEYFDPITLKITQKETGKLVQEVLPDTKDKQGINYTIDLKTSIMLNSGDDPLDFNFYNEDRKLKLAEQELEQTIVNSNSYQYSVERVDNSFVLSTVYAKSLTEYEKYKQKKWDYKEYQKLPIKEKHVLFESFSVKRFSDNPKAIYEYMKQYYPDYTFIWSLNDVKQVIDGENEGTLKVKFGSPEYYEYLATSKYFVSNYNAPAFHKRDGQVDVQTMHGTPLKKMGFDVTKSTKNRKMLRRVVGDWDIYSSSSTYLTNIMRGSSFNYEGEIINSGYPRNDYLFDQEAIIATRKKIYEELNIPSDKKIILYAPTWRTKTKYEQKLPLKEMEKQLSNEYVLIYRSHYLVEKFVDSKIYNDFVRDGHGISDVKELLVATDLLITDYSSIMFDYSILNRPMLFFTYDYEKYINQLRGTYFDLKQDYPELIAETTTELMNKIHRTADISQKEARDRFRDKFNEFEKGTASQQIVDAMIKFSK